MAKTLLVTTDEAWRGICALLESRGFGQGPFERLDQGKRTFIYIPERSTAWWVNTPAGLAKEKTLKIARARARSCMRVVLPSSPEAFSAWMDTTKVLSAGDHVFWSYGRGATHNADIRKGRKEVDERSRREPRGPRAKRERAQACGAFLHAAKAAKKAALAAAEGVAAKELSPGD